MRNKKPMKENLLIQNVHLKVKVVKIQKISGFPVYTYISHKAQKSRIQQVCENREMNKNR